MSNTYRRPKTSDRKSNVRAKRRVEARDPRYLRFLESYGYESFIADGRIGPLAAFERTAA